MIGGDATTNPDRASPREPGASGTIGGEAPTPRNPIACAKLKELGMTFGGESRLKATIEAMVGAIRTEANAQD